MASSKTIVIWGDEDILSLSIENFISTREGWKVINLSTKKTLDDLILAVENTPADLVIIHEGGDNCLANFSLQLLHDHPAIRVISLSLEDNMIEIFSEQRKLVHQFSDLIGVFENGR